MPLIKPKYPEGEEPPASRIYVPVPPPGPITHEEHLRREGVRIRRVKAKVDPMKSIMEKLGTDEEAARAENLRKYQEWRQRQGK